MFYEKISKEKRQKVKYKKKQTKNKLIVKKNWWDSISGRRFGNQTLYPLNHHRQHAVYRVFNLYIINDLVL